MCGIYFSISRETFVPASADLLELLSSRGPDSINERQVRVTRLGSTGDLQQGDEIAYLSFTSSVLSVRGDHITEQPLVDEATGSLLCWNGDAWKINNVSVTGSDTDAVFSLMLKATMSYTAHAGTPCGPEPVGDIPGAGSSHYGALGALGAAIEGISGPFAFVFYDALNRKVLFGRDCLGRRSLLQRYDDKGNLIISSISDGCSKGNWRELDNKGIYWIDLMSSGLYLRETASLDGGGALKLPFTPLPKLQWAFPEISSAEPHLKLQFAPLSTDLPRDQISPLSPLDPPVLRLRQLLMESLALRIQDIPERSRPGNPPSFQLKTAERPAKVAILFSGGLDCTVLARLAHDILPSNQTIDLLNVAFENPRVVNASKASRGKDAKTKQGCKNVKITPAQSESIHGVPADPMASPLIEAAKHRPATSSTTQSPYEMCPDRITGRKSLAELKKVCHDRHWNFVEINIPYPEALEHRKKIISLIHPHNTEMDLSIAFAFYFAARGAGVVYTEREGEAEEEKASKPLTYTTPARILISGLGADELFAGYSRHGAAFARDGFPGLLEGMDLDISRLGERNLGRDDRIIAHHGKHARYPYLDEALLDWALRAPVWVKTGFGQDNDAARGPSDGEFHLVHPEKKILRLLAWNLGLRAVAGEKKRA
ncbi:hypothetical protein GP486_005491, partial [Trichoglossum hirsutum]